LTWIPDARFLSHRRVLVLTFVLAGIFGIAAVLVAEPLWVFAFMAASPAPIVLLSTLMRCRGCGRSATWWGARNVRKADFLGVIRSMDACPYCGHSEER